MCNDAPAPPDYVGQARAQGEANKEAALQTAQLSNPNTYGPTGSQTVTWGSPYVNPSPGSTQADWQNQPLAGGLYNPAPSINNSPMNPPGYSGPTNPYQSSNNVGGGGPQPNATFNPYSGPTLIGSPDVGGEQGSGNRGQNRQDYLDAGAFQGGNNGAQQATVTQTLSPTEQAKFDKNANLDLNLLDTATSGLGRVNDMMDTPFDMSQVNDFRNPNFGDQSRGYLETNGMQDLTGIDPSQLPEQGRIDSSGFRGYQPLSNNGMTGMTGVNAGQLSQQGDLNTNQLTDYQSLNADGMQNLTGINSGNLSAQGSIDPSALNRFQSLNNRNLRGFQGVDAGSLSANGQLENLGDRQMQGTVGGQENVYNAIVERRSAEFKNQRQQAESDLIARGFTPGTEGYRSRMSEIDEQQNDFNLGARAQAGQEQQRLFNMESSARGQDFGQNAQVAQFAQQLRQQGMNEQQIEAQINNQIRGQQFNERNATSQNAMAERGQRFNEQERAAQFAQQLRAQGLNEQQVEAQVNSAMRDQQFGERAMVTDAASRERGQQFSERQQVAQFKQQLRAAGLNDQQVEAQVNRQNRTQQFTERDAMSQDAMSQRGQQFQEQERMALFQQGLRAQGLSEQQIQAQINAAMRSQQFGERATQASFDQSEKQRVSSQELNAQSANDQQRSQQIQEQAYLRQLPLNEINALRTGSQAIMPQFQSYTGANIAPPPLFDAAVARGNYDMAAYQNSPDLMGGLFSLGGAALGGPLGAKAGGFAAGLMEE